MLVHVKTNPTMNAVDCVAVAVAVVVIFVKPNWNGQRLAHLYKLRHPPATGSKSRIHEVIAKPNSSKIGIGSGDTV